MARCATEGRRFRGRAGLYADSPPTLPAAAGSGRPGGPRRGRGRRCAPPARRKRWLRVCDSGGVGAATVGAGGAAAAAAAPTRSLTIRGGSRRGMLINFE